MGQELKSALDIATDISNADEPSKRIAGNSGDLPSDFESDGKLFIGYQPRVSVRPTDGIDQSCEVWSNSGMEGRTIFGRITVIIIAAVGSIVAGKIIGALCVNEVDLVEIRV